MKNEHEDPGSFGETTAPASGKSFLKRQYMIQPAGLGRLCPHHPGRHLVQVSADTLRAPCRCRLCCHTARC